MVIMVNNSAEDHWVLINIQQRLSRLVSAFRPQGITTCATVTDSQRIACIPQTLTFEQNQKHCAEKQITVTIFLCQR